MHKEFVFLGSSRGDVRFLVQGKSVAEDSVVGRFAERVELPSRPSKGNHEESILRRSKYASIDWKCAGLDGRQLGVVEGLEVTVDRAHDERVLRFE